MKKSNKTRSALFTSVVSLLLCVSMLVGTTFAWFTDKVESGMNTITAGNLDVELEYKKVVNGQLAADWSDVKGATTIFDESTLWEPGHVEVAYLKVSNEGTLALKYQLGVNFKDTVIGKTEEGDDIKLSEHLVFAAVEMPDEMTVYSDREAVAVAAGATKGIVDYNGVTKALDAKDGTNDVDYVALIVYMPTTVENEANYRGTAPKIELGINLYATQVEAESDSFGDDYDENAWMNSFKVHSAQDLQAAINAGETNIQLEDDIDLTESLVIPTSAAGASAYSLRAVPNAVTINLNGKTINNPNGYVIENYGNVVITGNGTVAGLGGIRSHSGSVTIENGNFYASSQWQNGVYQHTLKAENSVVTINGGTFDATVNGQTNAMFNASTNGVITINGGSFKNVNGALGNFDPYLFTYENNGKVIIKNGTFYGGWRFNGATSATDIYGGDFTISFDGQSFNASSTHVLTVYGGTFTPNTAYPNSSLAGKISNVLAAGHTVIDNGDATYTVLPELESGATLSAVSGYPGLYTDGTNYYAYNAQGLIAMNNFWKANPYGNNMWGRSYNVMADIDATGYTWDSVWVNVGSNDNDGFVIDGHGNTITGLKINGSMFTGTPNGGNADTEPGKVMNLTFDNTTVVGDHWTAVVWGNTYGDLVFEDVHVVNSNITGKCNTAAFVGGTAQESGVVTVDFVNCSVENTSISANGAFSGVEGDWASDPNGANVYISRAFNDTKMTFVNCASEDNTVTNTNGVVGGGIYGYTAFSDGWWAGIGTCENFTNWNGVVVVNSSSALNEAIAAGGKEVLLNSDVSTGVDFPAANTSINLGNNTLTMTSSDHNVKGNLSVTNGNVDASNGYFDLRPSGDADYAFEGVVFNNTALNKTYGTCTDHIEPAFETSSLVADATMKFSFKNCTFNNTNAVFEAMSGKPTNIEAVFENCTFNLFGSDSAIEIMNYITANITIKDCTFNITATAGSGIVDALSGSTVNVTFEGANFLNGTAAVPTDASDASIKGTVNEVKIMNPAVKVKASSWAIDTLIGADTITCQGIATK